VLCAISHSLNLWWITSHTDHALKPRALQHHCSFDSWLRYSKHVKQRTVAIHASIVFKPQCCTVTQRITMLETVCNYVFDVHSNITATVSNQYFYIIHEFLYFVMWFLRLIQSLIRTFLWITYITWIMQSISENETALIIGLEKAITLKVSNTVSPYHKATKQIKDGIMCINITLLRD
jgi:hypothetical protein